MGAGAAGLAAAQTLQQLGLKVVCLEARSRAGGRVTSVSAILRFYFTCLVDCLHCRAIQPFTPTNVLAAFRYLIVWNACGSQRAAIQSTTPARAC